MARDSAVEPLETYEQGMGQYTNFFANLASEKARWQHIAILAIVINCVLVFGLIYVSTKATFIPYVIHVDEQTGYVTSLGSLTERKYQVNDAQINYFLGEIIKNTRTIPLDPVLYREQWERASMFFTKDAFRKVSDVYGYDVSSRLGSETTQPKIISIAKLANTENTYQVRWEEKVFETSTSKQRRETFSVTMSIKFEDPDDKKVLTVNPLGIYITDISFSEEGGTNS